MPDRRRITLTGRRSAVLSIAVAGMVLAQLSAQDAPDAPPKTPVVEGQVFDHHGGGVADVEVSLIHELAAPGAPPIAVVRTNQYGDFQIHHEAPLTGQYVVTFKKNGYAEVSHEIEIVSDELPPFIDFVMPGRLTLTGKVVDKTTGSPIAGAKIRVSAAGREWNTTSGDDGAFQVEQLLPGPGRVTVEAEGHARRKEEIASIAESSRLRIELDRERVVYIKTVTAGNIPVGDVHVECIERVSDDYLSLVTDEQGVAVLRGLPRETVSLQVRLTHPGYVSDNGFDRELALPPDADESHHQLVLSAAGSVSGKITDQRTGRPLQGVRVTVGTNVNASVPRDWTGFNGTYTVVGVPPGDTVVTTYLSGYAPQLKMTTVQPDRQGRVDFEIHASKDAAGIVVDSDGKPVAGAYVFATSWHGYAVLGTQALTGEDGRFVLTSIPDDGFEISIQSVVHEPLAEQRITPGKTDHRFELVPRRGGAPGLPATRRGALLKVGAPFPNLEMVTLDGVSLKLADLKGKTVLIDFWATWCGPCVIEIPNIVQVYKAFGSREDFEIIGISLDFDQEEKRLRKFIAEHKMAWTHVFGKAGHAPEAADACGVEAIPRTFLIASDGILKAVDLMGPSVKDEVKRLLDDQPADR